MRTRLLALALVLVGLALGAAPLNAQASSVRPPTWPDDVLELADSLPVQEGGRVKPLSTFASFTLLRLSGKRSIETVDGEKQTPTAWLLDVMLFPESAAFQELFLVQDSEVARAIGIPVGDKKKRDRWSYDELRPGVERLYQLAHEYGAIEAPERSSLEQQVYVLAENVHSFLGLAGRFDELPVLPPVAPRTSDPEWSSAVEILGTTADGEFETAHETALRGMARMVAERSDVVAVRAGLQDLHSAVVGLAKARDEYGKIGLENFYYRSKVISWSLRLFVLGFLVAAFGWLRPRGRWVHRVTAGLVAGGTLALSVAIVLRCVIRGRPPVSTLYETVLFVTATGCMVALFLEWLNRQRIALGAAAFLGTVGMFVANGYESLDKQDTMPSLVAVLDTNFWLATHVTAITIGYSAGMLAAILGSLYLVAKALRIKRDDRAFYRSLGRMVYGVVCFAVIFSLVGTVLGGIWANESWGRFWGWDPKENGALLIVISQVAILHGRMGGLLRDHGICMAAAFGGSVIAFSWWGVNLLGVGLHSYGFTSGVHTALWTYYGIQWGVVLLGGVVWLHERSARRAAA